MTKNKILLTIKRIETLNVVVESELTAKKLAEKFAESGDGINEYRFEKDSAFEQEVSFSDASESRYKPQRDVEEYVDFAE